MPAPRPGACTSLRPVERARAALLALSAVLFAPGCGSRSGLFDSPGPAADTGSDSGAGLDAAADDAGLPDAALPPDSGTDARPPCAGGLVTLASGLGNPFGLAVDGTSAYWADNFGSVAVEKVDLCGGPRVTLAPGDGASSLAIDATRVYWTVGDSVLSAPLSGGAATTLASSQRSASNLAVQGTSVYWMDFSAAYAGWLVKGSATGGTPVTLLSGLDAQSGMAVDATGVYWTTYNPGAVMKVALDGGAPVTLASGEVGPNQIAVGGGNVYWTNTYVGGVYDVSATGGAPVTLASQGGIGIAVDAGYVYWTLEGACPDDGGTCTGAVMKTPIGGGATVTLASGEHSPGSIAVDSTSVYWLDRSGPGGTSDGSLRKRTPK